jgi:ferric-dicitrate binding protein FerR (iron transport regulator)
MTIHRPQSTGSLSQQEHEELVALLNTLADDSLAEADERRLRELLDRGEPARRVFREFAALHAGLHWDYATLLDPRLQPPSASPERGAGRWPPIRRAAAVLTAAALAGAATALVWLVMAMPSAPQAQQGAGGGGLATVTQTRFLLSADGEDPLTVGQSLDSGRISLAGGAVELSLRNGVVVVFEGPGELDLASELSATLHDGNVVVRMPQGMKGFVVRTPTTDVLDLGTEFAVSVGADNTTDVQVYDGAVITSASRRPEAMRLPKRLVAGEAARFLAEPSAEAVPMAFRPQRFVRNLPADVGVPLRGTSLADEMRSFGPARHAAITVHRAPAGMVIDGRLDEWADRPGFSGSLDGSASCVERADGRMMYDEKCLYIAAHVGDPMPLRSIIDPEIDASWGWRGGAVQVRVSTDRQMGWPARGNGRVYYAQRQLEPTAEQEELVKNPRLAHLTMWFHAPTKTPCLTINHGMLFRNWKTNPAGFAGAFVADADGKGYTMEYAIPWSLLGCADDPPRSGDVLAAVWQVLWGDEAGRMRREQMVEVRNPDEPLRIHVWERAATWGRAEYR